ncbi:MAG: hypothetical protein IK077_10355 [Thermoguttaceae bacterium]|nr:hypothetical protein [Thermoguttaceae bacterium]
MGSTISFYCMHCGKLITFPSKLAGATAFCPYCRHGMVVPKYDPTVPPPPPADSEVVSNDETPRKEKRDSLGLRPDLSGENGSSGSSVVLIRSFLFPDRSRRLDVGRTLKINWFRRGSEENEGVDESVFVQTPDLSDDEFFERLRAESPSYPSAGAYVSPPVYVPGEEKTPWRERVDLTKLGIWTGITVVLIGLATLASFGILRLTNPRFLQASLQDPDPVPVEGLVVYRTSGGKLEGDEGAFVFLFPTERAFKKPLITYGASPNEKTPLQFKDFLTELEANGGYFERAGFEGFFDVEVKTPGVYKVLVVSFNVGDDVSRADEKTLREIGAYLFQPEEMLSRNRFLWKTERIEGSRVQLELNVGR